MNTVPIGEVVKKILTAERNIDEWDQRMEADGIRLSFPNPELFFLAMDLLGVPEHEFARDYLFNLWLDGMDIDEFIQRVNGYVKEGFWE